MTVMKRLLFPALAIACVLAALFPAHAQQQAAPPAPLRLAIAGLVHGHVTGFLKAAQARKDVQIVGVFEPDKALLQKYAERYKLADAVLFTDLATMLDRAKPEAVASFTNTYDHPAIVEAAASRGIDVMMEKPLAVSNAHAQRIRRAADRGKIDVLVNYETTWYPSHGAIWTLVKERGSAGGIDVHQAGEEAVQPGALAGIERSRFRESRGVHDGSEISWNSRARRPCYEVLVQAAIACRSNSAVSCSMSCRATKSMNDSAYPVR